MNNNKVSGIYSWPVIILALIFFWPLGLFLIIKRTSLDKTAVIKDSSGKGLNVIAFVLIVLGCLGVIGSFDPFDFGTLVVFLFFIVGGIILLNKAKKIKAEGETIKKYLSICIIRYPAHALLVIGQSLLYHILNHHTISRVQLIF